MAGCHFSRCLGCLYYSWLSVCFGAEGLGAVEIPLKFLKPILSVTFFKRWALDELCYSKPLSGCRQNWKSIIKKDKEKGCKKCKEKRSSGTLADAIVGPKFKSLLNLTFFLEQNELSEEFWRNFGWVPQNCSRQLWFPFLRFCPSICKEKLICLLVWSRIINL